MRASGNMDNRNRFQDTYYAFALEDYVPADSLVDYQSSDGSVISQENVEARYPEPLMSKEKTGANLFARYDVSEETYIDFSYGYQNSSVQTVFMEGTTTLLTNRTSTTNSMDLRANAGGLLAQISYLTGDQELYVGGGDVTAYDLNTWTEFWNTISQETISAFALV